MASQNPNPNPNQSSMYPQIINTNYDNTYQHPTSSPPSSSTRSPMYPKVEMHDLVENLFPEKYGASPVYHPHSPSAPMESPSAPPESTKESILVIPGAILHLIDKQYSVELATGDLVIFSIRQGDNTVAVFACVSDEIQWPLTKDVAAVKLDDSHYFFTFPPPKESRADSSDSDDEVKGRWKWRKSKKKAKESPSKEWDNNPMSYGLTIASKGQEKLLKELDSVLENCSSFSVQKVERKMEAEVLNGAVAAAREVSPVDLRSDSKKEVMEGKCAAYWTTLAPNVEEYSGTAAKLIAAGSGQLIKGILWCGDVTSDRLKRGDEVLKKRLSPVEKAEISPETMKRIKRVKRMTKMSEKVSVGVLSGVVKVSGFVVGSVANSKAGKKFFNLLPGEVIIASLDGFNKVCDAVEVAGKSVMSTSSTVTTGLVSQRYGEEAAKATNEGLDAAGHAIGTAWAVFKIRKALNPKSALKPSTLAKAAAKSAAAAAAAADKKSKDSK